MSPYMKNLPWSAPSLTKRIAASGNEIAQPQEESAEVGSVSRKTSKAEDGA